MTNPRFGRLKPMLRFLPALGFVLAGAGPVAAQPCGLSLPITWTLGANGNWGVGSNWSGGVYPNSAGANACVDDGTSTVALDVGAVVGGLQLAPGNALTIGPGQSLTVAGPRIIDSGTINLTAGSGKDAILSISGDVSLSGRSLPTGIVPSSVTLTSGAGGGLASIRGAGHTLTNVDNLIEGSGTIGDDGLNLVNGTVGLGGNGPGEINANSPGGVLTIGSGGGSFVNAWGVEVAAGSTLEVIADKNGFDQIGGFTRVDGTLIAPNGFINAATTHGVLNGQGLIAGHGTIVGNVVNSGIMDPSYFDGASGSLTITGDYSLLSEAHFYVEQAVGGELDVNGQASLDGALDLSGSTGQYRIVNYDSYSGNFAAINYNSADCLSIGADVWSCGSSFLARETFGTTGLTVDITGIPEPATWAMMLAGFAGMRLAGRRAWRRAAAASATSLLRADPRGSITRPTPPTAPTS